MWKLIDNNTPENIVLNTKIIENNNERNEQLLIKKNNLWWTIDGSMYVYYTPTHYFAK